MMEYEYCAEKPSYSFSEYKGIEFIRSYLRNRNERLKEFKKKANSDKTYSELKPIKKIDKKVLNKNLKSFEIKRDIFSKKRVNLEDYAIFSLNLLSEYKSTKNLKFLIML